MMQQRKDAIELRGLERVDNNTNTNHIQLKYGGSQQEIYWATNRFVDFME